MQIIDRDMIEAACDSRTAVGTMMDDDDAGRSHNPPANFGQDIASRPSRRLLTMGGRPSASLSHPKVRTGLFVHVRSVR